MASPKPPVRHSPSRAPGSPPLPGRLASTLAAPQPRPSPTPPPTPPIDPDADTGTDGGGGGDDDELLAGIGSELEVQTFGTLEVPIGQALFLAFLKALLDALRVQFGLSDGAIIAAVQECCGPLK